MGDEYFWGNSIRGKFLGAGTAWNIPANVKWLFGLKVKETCLAQFHYAYFGILIKLIIFY